MDCGGEVVWSLWFGHCYGVLPGWSRCVVPLSISTPNLHQPTLRNLSWQMRFPLRSLLGIILPREK